MKKAGIGLNVMCVYFVKFMSYNQIALRSAEKIEKWLTNF